MSHTAPSISVSQGPATYLPDAPLLLEDSFYLFLCSHYGHIFLSELCTQRSPVLAASIQAHSNYLQTVLDNLFHTRTSFAGVSTFAPQLPGLTYQPGTVWHFPFRASLSEVLF